MMVIVHNADWHRVDSLTWRHTIQ